MMWEIFLFVFLFAFFKSEMLSVFLNFVSLF